MWVTLIASSVFILSMIGISIIIGRKFPTLARLNVQSPASSLDERKKSLIERRLKRKVSTAWSTVGQLTGPVGQRVQRAWEQTHQKLVDLEHEYKIRSLPVFLNRRQRHKIDQEISELLTQARALVDDGETAAAEEKCLQAIRLEPRSVPAFELVGQIYLQTKEYGHAKEVYQYLLKLTGDSDAIYEHLGEADLAEGHLDVAAQEFQQAIELNRSVATYHLELAQVYRAMGDGMKAFASAQEASRLEPNSPKVLDELIESSMMAGKKEFALDALNKLTAVNPENGKIAAWRDQIDSAEFKARSHDFPRDEQPPSLYDTHTSPTERS